MSVVRGRPPGLAGGIIGTSKASCSSLRACPAPKSPPKARLSAVHMTCLQQGCPLLNADPASVCPSAHPSRIGFSNGLLIQTPVSNKSASAGCKLARPINSFVLVRRITRLNSLPAFMLENRTLAIALSSFSEAGGFHDMYLAIRALDSANDSPASAALDARSVRRADVIKV